jgi:polyribonucleotide nucleotidyltransferase
VGEFGIVDVASQNKDDINAAIKWIKEICTVPEVGQVYDAKVVSIVEFGAFLEFLPGKEGLMHISEYDWGRTETLDGLISEGDEFQVKVINIDEKTGKIKLSRKALLPKPEGYEEEKPNRGPRREGGNGGGERNRGPRREGGDRGPRREGGNGGHRR